MRVTDTQTPTLLCMTIALLVPVVMAQVRADSKHMVPKQTSSRRLNGAVITAETEPELKLRTAKSSVDEILKGQKW